MARKGAFYGFCSVLLICSAITTIALTSVNLYNLLENNEYVKLYSFKYTGYIEPLGEKNAFCMDRSYLQYAWLSGFMTVSALLTGLMAWGVKDVMSRFAVIFLSIAFITILATLVSCGSNSSVLYCHVVLTGLLPSGILFIAILSLLDTLLTVYLFVRIWYLRADEVSELRYGSEPLPDPWDMDYVEKNDAFILQGKKPKKQSKEPEGYLKKGAEQITTNPRMSMEEQGYFNAAFISPNFAPELQPTILLPAAPPPVAHVAAASNVSEVHASSTALNYGGVGSFSHEEHDNHTLTKQERVVLNAANRKVHHQNHQNLSRHQLPGPSNTLPLGPPPPANFMNGQPNQGFMNNSLPIQPYNTDHLAGCRSNNNLSPLCVTTIT